MQRYTRHNCSLSASGAANIPHLEGLAPIVEATEEDNYGMTMSLAATAVVAPDRHPIDTIYDRLALAVTACAALVVILTFRDYGLGWDDYTHAEYADLLLKLYGSGFTNRDALSFANLYMYGGGFDLMAALLHKILPLDLFETRRLLGGAVGIIGLVLTWRVARRVGGPLAGFAAMLALALSPHFYGHAFMNPKDVPFAVTMMVALLGSVRLIEEYPRPSPRTVLLLGTGAGLAIGSRILGGFSAIYLAAGLLPLIIADLRERGFVEAAQRVGRMVLMVLPGLLFGYLAMALIWPWGVMEPLNPFRAVGYFSHFFEKPWKELYAGELLSVQDMPWTYLPAQFVMRTPEIVSLLALGGVALSLDAQRRHDVAPQRRGILLMLVLAATLPVLIAMVKRPALYNEIRHFLFVVPPMAVLAGIAFARMFEWLSARNRKAALGAAAFAGIAALLPLSEIIRLHPYQYTYFNHASGTVRAADQRYTLDYWGLAFKQASDDLRGHIAARGETPPEGRKWKVAVCGPQRPAQVGLGPDFTIGWESAGADFAMTLGEFYCRKLGAPVIFEIKRDNVVYARVYDIRGWNIPSLLSIPAP
jgi:hypothetical protein